MQALSLGSDPHVVTGGVAGSGAMLRSHYVLRCALFEYIVSSLQAACPVVLPFQSGNMHHAKEQ